MPLFPASPVLGRLFQGFRVQRIARGCLRGSLTFTAFWGEDEPIQAPQQTCHQGSDDQDQGKHVRHANSLRLFTVTVFTNMKDGKECFLRQLNVTDLLHTLLTFFLLLQQLFLTADVAAIALSQNVFTQLLHG